MKRLTTRSIATAQAIANREDFRTSGALYGESTGSQWSGSFGHLTGDEKKQWQRDCYSVDYVVWSYSTPIAWHTPTGWYVVQQKFSLTTTKHQGNLYLIPNAERKPLCDGLPLDQTTCPDRAAHM